MQRNLILGSVLALGFLLARGLMADDGKPMPPKEAAGGGCALAHAKGGTVDVPFDDAARMKELQGLDGKLQARVTIEWPKEDEVLEKGEGVVKYQLSGYEIGKDDKGNFQHCHLILDNKPYEADYDHTTTLEKLNGGKPVEEGTHLLTIFPARNFHLSVKSEGACGQVRFHVGKKAGSVPGAKDPQLIYSRPKGVYDSSKGEAKNILLDFYLLNAKLGRADYLVEVKLETDAAKYVLPVVPVATEWAPCILLKDAVPGKYKITLELKDKDGKAVPGPFNRTTREITVK